MAERCDTCGQQTEYNGWPTYETWLVNLHLSNDEGLYNMVLEQAKAHVKNEAEEERSPDFLLMEWLEDWVKMTCERSGQTDPWDLMTNDLMGAALSRVEWRTIAEHWIEDAREVVDLE